MELSVARRAVKVARMTSASVRALPDFVIVGAQKAGTTSLFAYLADHPNLVSSSPKEIHYFDGGLNPEVDTYALGEKWYRSHFPLKVTLGRGKKTFEASPLYLCNPLCAERIRSAVPNAKIIAVLRNPTDRAISHYFHELRRGQEPLSIMEAFYAEEARLAAPLAAGEYKNNSFIHHTYKFRGRYAEQLPRYFDAFGRENVLVIDAGSFFRQPAGIIKRVCSFLDVREFSLKEAPAHNIGKNRQAVEAGVRDYLSQYFSEYNEQLFDLLGERYNWD